MDKNTLEIIFFAGFVVQSLFALGKSIPKMWFSIPAGLLIALISAIDHRSMSPLGSACLGYVLVFTLLNAKYLLKTIGPELLILWSSLLIYISYTGGHQFVFWLALVSLILGGWSYVTYTADKNAVTKLYFYISYLLLVSGVGYFGSKLVHQAFNEVFIVGYTASYSPVAAFLAGSALTTVAVSLSYVYLLVPLKNRTSEDVTKLALQMVDHYNPNRQNSPLLSIFVLVVGLVLLVNAAYQVVSDELLLPLVISLGYVLAAGSKPESNNHLK